MRNTYIECRWKCRETRNSDGTNRRRDKDRRRDKHSNTNTSSISSTIRNTPDRCHVNNSRTTFCVRWSRALAIDVIFFFIWALEVHVWYKLSREHQLQTCCRITRSPEVLFRNGGICQRFNIEYTNLELMCSPRMKCSLYYRSQLSVKSNDPGKKLNAGF